MGPFARTARTNRNRVLTRMANMTCIVCAMIICGGFTVCLFAAIYFVSTNVVNFALN